MALIIIIGFIDCLLSWESSCFYYWCGIEIYFCDLPVVNTMVLGIFASVAQYERELISKRTKDALAANKARGILSGTANSHYRIDEESKKQASIASARTRTN